MLGVSIINRIFRSSNSENAVKAEELKARRAKEIQALKNAHAEEIQAIKNAQAEEVAELTAQIEELKSMVAALTKELERLKANNKKSSTNSNNAPSTDGFKKAPATKSLREKTGRPSGGQKGHKGHTLDITEKPDEVIELNPPEHCECGGKIIETPEVFIKRQVKDVEKPKIITVEYRSSEGYCEKCGKLHKACFPKGVDATVTYGEGIQTMAAYLNIYQLLPLKRTSDILRVLFGVNISQGSIINANKSTYEGIKNSGVLPAVKNELINSEVVGFDETGFRVNGKLEWLHSAGTTLATLYVVHKKRGKEAMDAMGILPNYKGTAVHDHWKAYYNYSCAHAECNAHILRHLVFLHETLEQSWAGEMICLLLRIKKHVDLSRLFGSDSLSNVDIEEYERIYRQTLINAAACLGLGNPYETADTEKETTDAAAAGAVPVVKAKRRKKTEQERMVARLADYEQETLMFMYDFNVPFDNNGSERDCRMPKLKVKISGCFRTDEGAEIFAGIRSYISTTIKKGGDVTEALKAALRWEGRDYLYPT